ncbi:SDR family oxidoreductase [Streptomyces sp. NPDC001212]
MAPIVPDPRTTPAHASSDGRSEQATGAAQGVGHLEDGAALSDRGHPVDQVAAVRAVPHRTPRGRIPAPQVRVTSVSPGPVATPILDDFKRDHGVAKVEGAGALLGRFGEPADIARVVAFLLSDSAAWINGTDIRVDGGLTACRTAQEASEAGTG